MKIHNITYKIVTGVLALGLMVSSLLPAEAACVNEKYMVPMEHINPVDERSQPRRTMDLSAEAARNEAQTVAGKVEDALLRCQIVELAEAQLGTRYSWGGKNPSGFDCSGLVYYLFTKQGFDMNRTATAQLEHGVEVAKEDLLPGDLVFFKGTSGRCNGRASHVGIYIGNGQFVHASNSGVVVTDLSTQYYTNHYLSARRLIGD